MLKLINYIKVDEEIELKKFTLDFAQELFDVIDSNREHLRKFLPWLDMCKNLKDEIKFIEEMTGRFNISESLDLCIFYNGKIAGAIGTHAIDWSNKKTSLGYWLGKNYEGKGIITRSCQSLVNYLFDDLKLKRVEIYCAVDNPRSRSVAERLRFKKEGILCQSENLYGKYIDLYLYALINHKI